MPNLYSSLINSYTLSSISKISIIDTKLNIIKRPENIIYQSNLNNESTSVAFLSNNPILSETNLSIADRSTSIANNRVVNEAITTFVGSSFTIDTENFLVTDVFTTSTNTISSIPLFYKHIVGNKLLSRVDTINEDWDLAANTKLISISFLDQFLQPIKVTEQYVDYTTGIVYTNLLSDFQSEINYTLYYVKYTVNINGVIKTYIEMLDSIPVFRVATYNDLTLFLTIINDGRKVYLLEEISNTFNITLPTSSTYAYKPLSTARIQLLPPVGSTINDTWFVRVSNGKFFTTINSSLYKYHIAEFLNQSFSPIAPIKHRQLEESLILDKNLIKLDQDNIYENEGDELFVNIEINQSDETGVASFTTSSGLAGSTASNGTTYQYWTESNRKGIRSIDHKNGIIDLDGFTLKDTWSVISDYYYTETNYEFSPINFNPITNQDTLIYKYAIFLYPDNSLSSRTQSLYYLKIDKSGKVVESNWDEFNNTTATMVDDNLPLFYQNYPDYFPVTGFHSFIDEFTVESVNLLSSGLVDPFLVLGDVIVAEAQHYSETSIFDSRKRGGGIMTSAIETARTYEPEYSWYWDEGYWDGIPYPGNASYFIELPAEILEGTSSGIFSHKEIKDIVNRHTAAGVYPIIKSYGIDYTVTGIYPIISGVSIYWNSHV
jgi:hypothetical protein